MGRGGAIPRARYTLLYVPSLIAYDLTKSPAPCDQARMQCGKLGQVQKYVEERRVSKSYELTNLMSITALDEIEVTSRRNIVLR